MWQFMSFTGKKYGLRIDPWVDERSDFEKSTRAAARYLKDLYERYGDWYLAMAAYNAGEGKILRVMAKTGFTDFWQIAASGLIKPQTVNYVPAVIASTLIVRNPAHYGFEVEYEAPLDYDLVRIDRPVSLRSLAAAEGVDLEDLQKLNPELRTEVTPGGPGGYDLKVPVGTQVAVLTAFAAAPTARPPSYRHYTARRGDTIASVARKFKVAPASLSSANGLPQNASLKKGKVVLIPKAEPVRVASKSVKPASGSSATKQARVKPKTAPAAPVETAAKHYTVRGGDTLYRIAVKHGTTVAQLLAFNSLIAPGTIRPGDTLKIPTKTR
jgi:membrane-bound lytic murein transglycosylase D